MKKVSLTLKKKTISSDQQAITNFFGNASSQMKFSAQESGDEIKIINKKRKATSPLKAELINKHKSKSYKSQLNVNQLENGGSVCNENKSDTFKKINNYENNKSHSASTALLQPCDVRRPQKAEDDIGLTNESIVDELEFGRSEMNNLFEEDWDIDTVEDAKEDLDLNILQRCEIVAITKHPQKLELKLKSNNNNKGTCFVAGNWLNTSLEVGEIISITASKDSSGYFTVNNSQGLLVLRPDHLMSSTSVVSGVFCRRKAVLQERWRGIDSANIAMTMGILIHELVQKALVNNISNISDLKNESEQIIKDSLERLYESGISGKEASSNMQVYFGPLAEFMQTYVVNKSPKIVKDKWNGKIEKVLDIEENVCCPQLGLKGKIDATLEVTIHKKTGPSRASVPLELKSGRASASAEHTGQLVLYGMMMAALRGEHPERGAQPGLLLYLKDKVDLREIDCAYPERRDLIILRNELVQHLAPGPSDVRPEKLKDIEDLSAYHQSLPEPVHHHSACSKCPYLTLCSLHLWNTNQHRVSEGHPLARLKETAVGHLSPEHIRYFLHWASLVRLEERAPTTSPLHALWTESWETRSKRGTCAPNLSLKRVTSSGHRYLHEFDRRFADSGLSSGREHTKGPQEGDYSIVSTEDRPWIASGVVKLTNHTELHILLERDLTRRRDGSASYCIDAYESRSTATHNLTNLGLLMEDDRAASRLRRLIVDRERPASARDAPTDPDGVPGEATRSLNEEQRRAVAAALGAEDYALIRGLPGTGKTQTLCALVCAATALRRRVLVTAHTHAAVDTLLRRCVETYATLAEARAPAPPSRLRVLRLGGPHATPLLPRSPESLAEFYESRQVVGVTCLGAAHPMLTKTEFDLCIVDEATQVLQSTVLRPLLAARAFVLVGDPGQLPPVVRSAAARKRGMEASLFHRLTEDSSTHTLSLQYRMNRPLMDLANQVAYDRRLRCADDRVAEAALRVDVQTLSRHSSASPWLVAACSPKPEDAAIFLDIQIRSPAGDVQKSLTNRDEACVVLAVIDTLRECGVPPSDIGVIAPYRDQVGFLRSVLAGGEVEVSTVDQFQGRDKSVIVYSCTRKEDARAVKESEVLNDSRRLAVSVTRAKHKLVVVGSLAALRKYSTLVSLAEACKTIVLEEDIITHLNEKYGTSMSL